MKEEKVYFENEGTKIEGILHSPDKKTKSLIIFVHGFTANRNGPDGIFVRLAEILSSKGFAVLRFNFRFTGGNWKEFHKMTISGEVGDLKLIVNEMSKSYENIALLGESLGGMISVLGYDERVKCLVLWYPAVFLTETYLGKLVSTKEAIEEMERTGTLTLEDGKKRFKIGRQFIEERDKINLLPYAKKISCPSLIIHGDSDTTVNYSQSERLLEVLGDPKKLEKIMGSNHAWWNKEDTERNPKAQQKAIELTVNWFEKWLR